MHEHFVLQLLVVQLKKLIKEVMGFINSRNIALLITKNLE